MVRTSIGLLAAVGHQDRQHGVEGLGLLDVVAVAVFLVLASGVAGEGVAAVGPPEGRAVVGIEGQHLLGQPLAVVGLHAEVAVEQVIDFGGVLQEEAVADALVADTVADDEEVRAVDGHPAIVRIDDRDADDAAAAHRVADQVVVDGIAPQHAFLAQMGEAGVADAAGAVAMVHGVAAAAFRIGAFDDDVARQVGDLAAELALAQVLVSQRLVQVQRQAVDLGDPPRLAALRGVGGRYAPRAAGPLRRP